MIKQYSDLTVEGSSRPLLVGGDHWRFLVSLDRVKEETCHLALPVKKNSTFHSLESQLQNIFFNNGHGNKIYVGKTIPLIVVILV